MPLKSSKSYEKSHASFKPSTAATLIDMNAEITTFANRVLLKEISQIHMPGEFEKVKRLRSTEAELRADVAKNSFLIRLERC